MNKLEIFEFVYYCELSFQPKTKTQAFLKTHKNFKKSDQVNIFKSHKLMVYPPKTDEAWEILHNTMVILDPIMVFERNSEGSFLRVSLLLALMKLYDLSLDDFIKLWSSNPQNINNSENLQVARLMGY